MPAMLPSALLPLLFLLTVSSSPATSDSEVVLEFGYTVSTVLDCNKPLDVVGLPSSTAIYPFSILPRPRSSDLLLLDHTGSAFYSVPIPLSQGDEIRLFSGKGVPGFADGDPTAAMFKNPRSFAIDSKENVYVADRSNHAIRKISRSGMTTTIAGGYSEKTGHIDGPAQNASFSNDFELVYVSKICALMISDRGNRLIRQLDLKPEDCAHESQAGLGVTSVSVIAILCVLFGIVLGFTAHLFFTRNTGSLRQPLYQQDMEALPNQSEATSSDDLLRRQKRRIRVWCRENVPLLEADVRSYSGVTGSPVLGDQLKDMISFDGGTDVLEVTSGSRNEDETKDASKGGHGKIEDMIRANLTDFARGANQGQMEGITLGVSCLVRRRPREHDGL